MDEVIDYSRTLMSALSRLSPASISSLSDSLSAVFRRNDRRLSAVVSSRDLFSLTLRRLYSLSLPQKSLLIARYLLSTLELIAPFFKDYNYTSSTKIKIQAQRDVDAVLLLLLFCEVRQRDPKVLETVSSDEWQRVLLAYHLDNVLSLSAGCFKVWSNSEVLGCLIDLVTKCKRFVRSSSSICTVIASSSSSSRREVAAASVAAVVALPSVEISGRRSGSASEFNNCAICKEEMTQGRDVCQLPCKHLFHWACALNWLTRSNTCPCCRLRLPSDDVLAEIDRLWDLIVHI